MSVAATSVRLPIDVSKGVLPADAVTQRPPRIWRGGACRFEVALFSGATLENVSNVQSATLTVKPLNRCGNGPDLGADPVLLSTISGGEIDAALDETSWGDGSAQHFLFEFTDAETILAPGYHWLSIHARTSGADPEGVALAAGKLIVNGFGYSPADTPPTTPELYYSRGEIDALLTALSIGGFYYEYVQSTPATTWGIVHGLGAKPNVTILDPDGYEMWTEAEYNDSNTVTLRFKSPTAGTAILS